MSCDIWIEFEHLKYYTRAHSHESWSFWSLLQAHITPQMSHSSHLHSWRHTVHHDRSVQFCQWPSSNTYLYSQSGQSHISKWISMIWFLGSYKNEHIGTERDIKKKVKFAQHYLLWGVGGLIHNQFKWQRTHDFQYHTMLKFAIISL